MVEEKPMLGKIYIGSIIFLGVLSILGVYLGYFGLIYPKTSALSITVSLIIAIILSRVEVFGTKNQRYIILLLALFAFLTIYASLPELVFPHGAGDFQNHARSVRIISNSHGFGIHQELPLVFPHKYPNVYYGLASLIYSVYPHTYIVNTVLEILLEALSVLGIFLIARKLLTEEKALATAFISAFTITIWFTLEQGAFPYLLGQFFFISSVYLLLKEMHLPLIISIAGLWSYPHLLIMFLLFIAFEAYSSKKRWILILPVISAFLMAPEVLGILWTYLSVPYKGNIVLSPSQTQLEPFRGTLLLRGGILTPPLLSLPIFLFSLLGIYLERNRHLLALTGSIGLMIFAIFAAFIYDYLAGYTKDIHLLYMAVKLFYLLVFPLSAFAAVGIVYVYRSNLRILLMLILAFQFAYFVGYIPVLKSKANFHGAAYEVFEYMDTLDGEFTVGVDRDLIKNTGWRPRFPYKSIVDLPDEGYLKGRVAEVELNRALQLHWANYTFTDKGPTVINSKGEEVIKYSKEGVDYFISTKNLERPILFKEGEIKVYRMG